MTKIAVFSDTHLQDLERGIPYLQAIMARHVPDAALVLHAGDVGDPDLLLAFADYPLLRVLGNTDVPCSGVAIQTTVKLSGTLIGMQHGWGGRHEIEHKLREAFPEPRPDVIVYGHTHWPTCQLRDGILMFNPGSCVERRTARHFTFGVLELNGNVAGRIISVDDLAARHLRS